MRAKMKKTSFNAALIAIMASFGLALPAQAGLLSPLIWLVKPRLERHLAKQCIEITAGKDIDLKERMQQACKDFTKPLTTCLIKQTEASGRELGVIVEIIRGEFGNDIEVVAKRCSASILDLPTDTFKEVPLLEIIENLSEESTDNSTQELGN